MKSAKENCCSIKLVGKMRINCRSASLVCRKVSLNAKKNN